MKTIYNEGRVVGLSQYELYVRQLLSLNPEATPMTEREWLTNTLANNTSMILRIPAGTSRGVHDYVLPEKSNLCACTTVYGSLFEGEVSLDENNMWATKVESYGDAISNTVDLHPETPGEPEYVPYKEDPSEENPELLERANEFLKIRSALVIQPGDWEDVEDLPDDSSSNSSSSNSGSSTEEPSSGTSTTTTTTVSDYSEEDDDEDRILITIDGTTVTTDLEVVEDSETGAKIVKLIYARSYLVSGSGSKILLSVEGGVNADIKINNLTLDNSALTGSYFIDGDEHSILNILLRGTSTVVGGAGIARTIFSEIFFRGTGKLTCSLQQSNAIVSDGGLVSISGGTLSIQNCVGNGIRAEYNSASSYSETNGLVSITGGVTEILNCQSDGISAENVNLIDGGLEITTYFRSASKNYFGTTAYTPSSSESYNYYWPSEDYKYKRINVDTGSHTGIKVGREARTIVFLDSGSEPIIQQASGRFTMSGGTLIVDTTKTGLQANVVTTTGYNSTNEGTYIIGSPSDAINCYGDVVVTGGKLKLSAGKNGITCAGDLDIVGDSTIINVLSGYEGFEGQLIKIGQSGYPTIKTWTCDNGVRAARYILTYSYDTFDGYIANDKVNYTLRIEEPQSDNNFYFYDGLMISNINSTAVKSVDLPNVVVGTLKTVNYRAYGSCIECLGSYYQYNAKLKCYGESTGDNPPVHTTDEYMYNASGYILTTGVGIEGEAVPKSGSGIYLTLGTEGPAATPAFTAGQYWKIVDPSNNMVDFGRVYYSGSYMVYGSPLLTGEGFTLSVVNNAPGLVDDDNVPDEIDIEPEPEPPTPPGPEPEPPEPEPPVPEPTKAAKYLEPDLSKNAFVRILLSSKVKADTYILIHGFVDKVMYQGEAGFPVQGHSNRPEDGDFLGPATFPWSCPIVMLMTTDVQEAVLKAQALKNAELEAATIILKYRTMYLGTLHIVTWDTPLLCEDGEVLLTEDGDYLMAEKTGTVAEMWQEEEEDNIVYYVPWWDDDEEPILTEDGEEIWAPKSGTITEMIIDGGIL